MKILSINGSFRGSKGFSKFLIDKIFEGARKEGAECENVNLSELKINHCIDCQVCQKPEHFLKCVFNDKDDVSFVIDKMREADIIVFATPIYTFGISSLLKMLFERYYSTAKVGEFNLSNSGLFFHHVNKDTFQKPFVPLIVCDNVENEMTENAVSYFKIYSRFMDAQIVGTLIRKSAGIFGFNKKESNNSSAVLDVYDAYIKAGRELALNGRISKNVERKANRQIINIPLFVKPMLKLGLGREKVIKAHNEIMEPVIKRN